MRMTLLLCALLAVATISASGGEQLKVSASPIVSFAPSTVRVQVRIVPSDDNRGLEIVAESDEFYRSSQVQLDGGLSPAVIMFEFRELPGGEYHVYGILTDSSGHRRAVTQQRVRVVATGLGS
jgi:hypothetical protein